MFDKLNKREVFALLLLSFLLILAGISFVGSSQAGHMGEATAKAGKTATLPPPIVVYDDVFSLPKPFVLPTSTRTPVPTRYVIGPSTQVAENLSGALASGADDAQVTKVPVENPLPTPINDENPGFGAAPTPTPSAQETVPPPTATSPAQEVVINNEPDGFFSPQNTAEIGPVPTPVATNTVVPTPTIEPTPDATRFCTDDEHDTTRMHGRYLHDEDGEPVCTYDHSHKPGNEGYPSNLFLRFTGQQISYPWATGGGTENLLWPNGKHEAYNWEQINIVASDDGRGWICPETNCSPIDKIEILWHGMASNKGFETRFHSFAALIRMGNGYVFWGGWMDCGQTVYIDGAPFVIDTSLPQPSGTSLKHTQTSNRGQTWYCKLPNLFHQDPLPWGTATGNFIGQQYSVNLAPPTSDFGQDLLTVCVDTNPDCDERDQSKFAHDIMFDLSGGGTDFLDPDANGIVEDYRAYLTRYGEVNTENCGDPYTDNWANRGLDCVPFQAFNVERGLYHAQATNSLVRLTRPDTGNNAWWTR